MGIANCELGTPAVCIGKAEIIRLMKLKQYQTDT